MSDATGFIDLRVNHGARGVGDDSVWPSFTDIMTVIVMIFLMALVVIMVRNFELDRQLVSTITAKDAAALANEELVEQMIRLEYSLQESQRRGDRLTDSLEAELARLANLSADQEVLKSQLAALTLKRKTLEQQNLALQADQQTAQEQIEKLSSNEAILNQKVEQLSQEFSDLEIESSKKISSLASEKNNLGDNLEKVSAQLRVVQSLLRNSQGENQDLVREVAELQAKNQDTLQRFGMAREEILELSGLVRQRESENAALEAQAASSDFRYQSLQEEYEVLDEQYRKLIRAARSPAGKYVVEVWVEKTPSGFVYQIRKPEDVARTSVSREQLDQILQQLKNQKAGMLYTKIVIPEDSELSHNEAWDFTQEILQRYDYYYQ